LIGLIIFGPLPAASVHPWSILVIQLIVSALTIGYLVSTLRPQLQDRTIQILRWPGYLIAGFWTLILFQILPLPKLVTRVLSPGTFAFRQSHDPGFSSSAFLSVSLVPAHTLKTALALLPYFLMGYLIVKTIKKRSQIVRMFLAIYLMGVFQALYGLLHRYSDSSGFLSGTFISRNHFAGYLEMIIPIGIGLILARPDFMPLSRLGWKEKLIVLTGKKAAVSLLLLSGVILMSLALIFTRSRSGALLLVLIFLIFFFLSFVRAGRNKDLRKGLRSLIVLVFIIILFISLYVGMEATWERLSPDRLLQESRPGIWKNSLELYSRFPLFGTGLGTFASLYPHMEGDGRLAKISHAHNDYLEYLTETGFFGFALLFLGIFWIYWECIKRGLRKRHPVMQSLGSGGLVAVMAILAHGMTDFNLHIPANMMLFSVILSLTFVTVTYRPSEKGR